MLLYPLLLLFILLALLAMALSAAWAPFAAFICARIARQNGLNAGGWAVSGAMYSALLFLPWIYLKRRMRGEATARQDIATAYVFVYLIAAGAAACNIVYLISLVFWDPLFSGPETPIRKYIAYLAAPAWDAPRFAMLAEIVLYIVAGALALVAAAVILARINRCFKAIEAQDKGDGRFELPDKSCIMPFALSWGAILISAIPWLPWLGVFL